MRISALDMDYVGAELEYAAEAIVIAWEMVEGQFGHDFTDDIYQTYSNGIPDGDEDAFLEMQVSR